MTEIINIKKRPSHILNLGVYLTFFFVVTLPLIFIRWRSLQGISYVITNGEICLYKDFIEKKTNCIKLRNIKNVSVEQPFFLKVFSLSNLIVTSHHDEKIILAGIKDGEVLLATLQNQLNKQSLI